MARPSAPPSGRRSQSSRVAVGWVGPAAQHLNADDPRVKAWELRFGHGTGLWGAGELVPTALLEGILLFRRCSARRPRRWHNGTTRLQVAADARPQPQLRRSALDTLLLWGRSSTSFILTHRGCWRQDWVVCTLAGATGALMV